ncbi:SgcJ/EcaC family oxidoreductase [Bradyrhizobium arachidis]|uniref:SgcJ/EcaC family oxidoreductase n=1 Tax=Bradyrhizobium TaxID=374 RepID=UPI00216293D2|nr:MULTISPECIES: SgcJ/EcaC family oxidoreductase [Bradyrhizobium]MDN4986864.1 SgcJ/EcaC family oxidoreductase [Bradyrhizobium sp. WYCCWR 13022]UVO37745.1 SgcJ/EcaC family oxidoreductase [Bradyrhizobium arachidis]
MMRDIAFRVMSGLALLVATPVLAGPKEDAYAIVEKWSSDFNALDAEQTASNYAPDAIVIGTFGKQLTTGASAITGYFKAVAASKAQVKLQDWSAIELSPDAVAIAGFYEFSVPKDGQTTSIPARYTFALFKREGVWKIGHHHSSPRPH